MAPVATGLLANPHVGLLNAATSRRSFSQSHGKLHARIPVTRCSAAGMPPNSQPPPRNLEGTQPVPGPLPRPSPQAKSPPPPPSPSSASNQAASNSQGLPALYVKRTIRGGQTVEYPGTVVVYGNVNRQSAILAGGDIVVWGRLNGEAHAGKDGDRDCQIMAMEMHPSTIRIADRVAYGPEGKELYPEVARIGMYASSVEERIGMAARLSGKGASLNQMSRAGKSAAFTGAYIFLVGLALLVAPLTVFGLLFDVRTITGGWIRVGGVLCMVFGMQYLGTALGDAAGIGAQAFYTASVVSRMVLFILFAVLVAVREVQATLLLLAAVNLAGALLMFANLRSDEQAGRSSVLS